MVVAFSAGRTLVEIRSLSRPPQLEVLLADERVQLASQFGGEVGYADEFKHIGEVPETMWRTDPGGQLEFHQSWQGQERGTNATNGHLGRIRKRHGLGPTVTGILTRDEHVDRDAVFDVAQASTARELLGVAAAECQCPQRLEPVGRQQNVDVDRHAPVTILVERHGPDDGVRDVRIVQKPDELVECPLDIRFTHEEPCRLCDPVPETRLAIWIEPLPAHSPPSQPWSRIASTGAPCFSQHPERGVATPMIARWAPRPAGAGGMPPGAGRFSCRPPGAAGPSSRAPSAPCA